MTSSDTTVGVFSAWNVGRDHCGWWWSACHGADRERGTAESFDAACVAGRAALENLKANPVSRTDRRKNPADILHDELEDA